ncbi:MAG: ABC transporter ATP-binding protein [Kiritimatiellae bacterium]|nr:ABC transporter ATP-binding protein [Kiritimatiellia bacterium]
MKLNSPLPQAIDAALRALMEPGEQVLYAQVSDLTLDRRYGESHLVATDRRIVVFGGDSLASTYRLDELKDVKVDELFGGARLLAVTEQGPCELIRYSKVFVPEFGTFARVINQLMAGRPPELPEEDEPAYCPKCGRPLAERGIKCPLCVRRWDVFKRLVLLLRPYRARALTLVGITFLGVTAQMFPPYITKRIVDDVIKGGLYGQLSWWIFAMLGSGSAFLLSRFMTGSLNAWLASRLIADLRIQLHDVVQRLRLGYINRRGSGTLISRIMSDTMDLRHFLIEGMPFLMVNMISFAVIATILIALDWKLALLVFLPVPFLTGGATWFWKKLIPLFHKRMTIYASLYSIVNETLGGIRVVKAFTQERRRGSEFTRGNMKYFQTEFRINKTFVGFEEVMFWIMQVGVTAVWFLAAYRLSRQDPSITLGDLLAFVGYIWLFYGPLQWFTIVLNWMTHAFSSAERIFAVIDTPPEIYDAPGAVAIPRMRGAIAFRDVHFSYEKGKEVIKGLSFEIEPGEMVGLVGRSGAGKSTIISLICRFHDVEAGEIRIDGHPIKKIKLEQVRRQIGMVMQDTFLFNVSILENIRYGSPDSSFEDVVRAAKAAYAHEFILDKEDGYDTLIGEQGEGLSGGEKQRLAIARAILHDPPILILDEATSSVDSETEKQIQEAIANLVRGRTTIAIAHRLATLKNASRLFVIDDGKMVERGTHEELMAKEGEYFKLVQTQTELNKIRAEVWSE